jgi:DNA-binding winged helix-turn-helix (wHTH) protein
MTRREELRSPTIFEGTSARQRGILILRERGQDRDALLSALERECEGSGELAEPGHTEISFSGRRVVVLDIDNVAPGNPDLGRALGDASSGLTVVIVADDQTAELNRTVIRDALDAIVRAILGGQGERRRSIAIGDAFVDLDSHLVKVGAHSVHLTPNEHHLLEELVARLNKTVPRSALLRALWGPGRVKGAHSLRIVIKKLRQKIEPVPARPRYLITEPTVGYRLQVAPNVDQ